MVHAAFTRRGVFAALAAASPAWAGRTAAAQGQGAQAPAPPLNRAARTVIGFAPGGSSDVVARLLAERLRGGYAPQVVVENRPGAGGRLAVEAVKGSPPDGTAWLQTPTSVMTIYPHVYTRTLRYDVFADFVPVTPVCGFPFGFAVAAGHPARTLAEFVSWAKARGAAADWASPAPGSMPHFLGVQFGQLAGLALNHIPYRGGAPMLQGLLAGDIQAALGVLGEQTPLLVGGQVRILAVTAPGRLPRLPGVPSFAELGFPAMTAEEQFGAFLPAGTPAPLVGALHRGLASALATAEMRDALTRLEYEPQAMEPAAFAARLRAERDHWGPIVAASGFRPEE
jgi:tripartite-type tricarboxylate transporter receptor subunit TctC